MRMIVYVIYVIFGGSLFALGCFEKVDSFWSGMGSTLFLIGVLRLLRIHRYNKNEEYRERMQVEMTDERNRFIRLKAWGWAGYLFVMIMGVSTIVFRVVGQEMYSFMASYMVCLILLLYWISYLILRKKY